MISLFLLFVPTVLASPVYRWEIRSIMREVDVEAALVIGDLGYRRGEKVLGGTNKKGTIYISTGIYGEELRSTVLHEIAHIYHLRNPYAVNSLFGRPPFVTLYAAESKLEDFCEVYTHVLMGRPIETRKQRYVQKLLNKKSI